MSHVLDFVCAQACTPYNADFDGDEMNCHVPQSWAARAEVAHLMMVPHHLISARNSRVVLGMIQDGLIGSFLLSDDELTRADAMRLISRVPRLSGTALPPGLTLHGRQIISMTLPKVTLVNAKVEIRDGQLLRGRLDKSIVGKSSRSLVHVVAKTYGAQRALEMMADLGRLASEYLQHVRGFSCGISDCVLPKEAASQLRVSDIMRDSFEHVDAIVSGIPDNSVAVSHRERESTILAILSNVLAQTGADVVRVLNDCGVDNRVHAMVTSGSKGSIINTAQILGCVGQSAVEGQRIHVAGRVLPCYEQDAPSVQSHGFVCNPFCAGLSPIEYFFHTQAGREGLVDTAVKTAGTGYLQRRLVKFMESAVIQHRPVGAAAPVICACGEVVQFNYGADSCAAEKLEVVSVAWATKSHTELLTELTSDEEALLAPLRDKIVARRCHPAFGARFDETSYVPVSCDALLNQAPVSAECAVSGERALPKIRAELLAHVASLYDTQSSVELRAHVIWSLRRARVRKDNVTADQLAYVARRFKVALPAAQAQPGNTVGILAAQSVGEPMTQLTLNSFHFAGVGEKNVTVGMPRLTELIGVSRQMRNPCCSVPLAPSLQSSPDAARELAASMPLLMFGSLVVEHRTVTLAEARDLCDAFVWSFHQDVMHGFAELPLVFVKLNKRKLKKRHLRPLHVRKALLAYSGDSCTVAISNDGEEEWSLYLQLSSASCDGLDTIGMIYAHRRFVSMLMQNVIISGMRGVTHAEVRVAKRACAQPDGSIKSTDELLIDVYGSIFRRLFTVDGLMWHRACSNDVTLIAHELGIEAANALILQELVNCFSVDGTFVHPRHVAMIADFMTLSGVLTPMTRHGMAHASRQQDVLNRASFEETYDVLLDAAFFKQRDAMRGVTSSIITGRKARLGTGMADYQWSRRQAALGSQDLRREATVAPADVVRSVARCRVRKPGWTPPPPPPQQRDTMTRKRAAAVGPEREREIKAMAIVSTDPFGDALKEEMGSEYDGGVGFTV